MTTTKVRERLHALIAPLSRWDVAVLVLSLALLWQLTHLPVVGERDLPDLQSLDDQVRKERFFDLLRPVVTDVNNTIAARRARLKNIAAAIEDGAAAWLDRRWLHRMAERYRIDIEEASDAEIVTRLLTRIDIIPVSLVLAQAAKESGWGTSRFAREGNNLFGQRCFAAGCGIVPDRRAPGASFEVAAFDSMRDSVESYILNINRHYSYTEVRELRVDLRAAGQPLDGLTLAEGLAPYSERRREYIDDIQSLIVQNDLEDSGTEP